MKNENQDQELEDLLTELDPPYESKDELKIGRLLDQYGIPFFYKQATIIYDQGKNQIWYPTFSIPAYNGAVIDYIAIPETEDYQGQTQQRREIYEQNQIPAVLITAQDLKKPAWQEQLYKKLEQIYHPPLVYELLYNNQV